ncbi:unnamed protein product [Angiostrongylus costaricensis]|uniref:G_PROTEIN_RECEP_F1_2 domain-containing protein n=1 Tax=Angiostrongylus costaricensis TaxID=334426 RepID=A0A0R3PQ20_ANGCS|nr:unnamed protein product [Angiostrongylus costaricensis]
MSSEECSRNESYDFWRYAVIVYVGTPIALAGVVCNCILLGKRPVLHYRDRSHLCARITSALILRVCDRFSPGMSYLHGWEHYQIFNFYVMSVLHIFVPFAVLLILNVSIVVLTKRKLHSIGWAVATFIDVPKVGELIRKESMMSSKKRRDEVRYATWTMVSITSTTRFYTLASDVVSILVAVNSLLRLFVYMLCSPHLRLIITSSNAEKRRRGSTNVTRLLINCHNMLYSTPEKLPTYGDNL